MSKAAVDEKLRAEGRCRLCQRRSSVRPLTRHRLVPGALGGPYEPDNCVPLCRPCHDLVDNFADRLRYRRMLRAAMWPAEVAFGYARLRDGFDRLYPAGPREWVLEIRGGAAPLLRVRGPEVRHLRHCKASAGGCVSGCPVALARAV